MRIVHTESSCGWGGQEIRILSEARGMRARGHDVLLLCPAEARIFEEAARFGIPVVALPIKNKGLPGVLALRGFLRRDHAGGIDVINCHSSTDSWLAALACASLSAAPALVRTRHVSAPVPNNFTSRWLYRRASEMVVTTGESLRTQLIRDNGLDAQRVVSVPTGIDLSQFTRPNASQRSATRAALQIDPDTFLVGIVATLRSWKGHRYLIEAIAALRSQMPEQRLRLMVVGDGPQREALLQLIERLGVGAAVVMCGNQNDVVGYLHAFDAFALPSYANEGVPQALLQAMACGVPVVTTDAGAITEIARAGETALVVQKEDALALSEALRDIMLDPEAAARRADHAAALVSARHSLDAMLDQMEAIFTRASRAASRPDHRS